MSDPTEFDPPEPEELSELLAGYEVSDLIATGGMGAVYRATQISLDRPVAIKLLPSELNNPEFRDHFQAEARAMARLNHPNLIGIYDFGQIGEMPYIVMELVEGNSLYYSSYGKAVDQTSACEIVIGICHGLAHAHNAGIIHRDIKPANILLDAKARPKIGDFGLASPSDAEADDGVVYGTPGYAAPEILTSSSAIGIPSDIFAVGVILYELLTGRMPGEPPTPPSSVSSCDPRLDAIFRRAVRRDPAMRYQSAGELAEELEKLLPTLGKSARPTLLSGAASHSAPMQRNPAGTAAASIPATPTRDPRRLKLATAGASGTTTSKPALTGAPAPAVDGNPPPPPPPVIVQSDSNWPIIRNLMIIAILIPVIIFAWGKKTEKEERLTKERNAREMELKKADNARKALRDKERREAEALAKLNDPPENTDPDTLPRDDPPPPAEIVKRTPLEQLADLRGTLFGGSRHSFPDGTIDRNNYHLFIVNIPMTWSQAAEFAEEHGGHLATPTSDAAINVIAKRMEGEIDRAWIGGGACGRSSWGWVTGEPWTHRDPGTTLGTCASLSRTGLIKARPNGEKSPFVIQWTSDGSNPGSISAQLARLAPTLGTPAPKWPPTVVAQDNRIFLLVHKPVSWDEADFIASSGKGHLAVPSNSLESGFIDRHLRTSLDTEESAWLGGRRQGDIWTWTTGEPWKKANWLPNSPDGGAESSALRFVKSSTSSGWDDAEPEAGNSDSFLIEWSSDSESVDTSDPSSAIDKRGELGKLRTVGRRFVGKKIDEQTTRLLENQKNLMWDISSWTSTLPQSSKDQFGPPINALSEALSSDGVLTPGLPVPGLSPKVLEYYTKALERQARFQKESLAEMDNLRQSYLGKLLNLRETLEKSGQKVQVEQIDNEIKSVGQTGESFQAHFER